MSTPKTITNTILIQAPQAAVWNALTDPEETKGYMFGCAARSDWQPGSPLLWEGDWEGTKMVFVKGHVAGIEPGRRLAYTVFDPNSTMADISENYLTVTYELAAEEDGTRLTVTQGDYSAVADGERRYNEAYNSGAGWNPILEKIKKQLEGDQRATA